MNFDISTVYLLFSLSHMVFSQASSLVHPAAIDGPQSQVVPSLFFPKNRVGSNRFRSRVFRDASQGYRNVIDSPRLFRASGRFHKRVQSATTHDIQNAPLPQDAVQIVAYKYDAEKHNEKKMTENDVISYAEAEDHARGIERTTMAVKVRKEETTTVVPVTKMPEQNSINEFKDNGQPPKTFFQTVTATDSGSNNANMQLAPQPPIVFTPPPPPPIAPQPFGLPNILPPQPGIQQQNLPSQPPPTMPTGFGQRPPQQGINPLTIPHQPSNPLAPFQPPQNGGQAPQPTINPLGQPTPPNQAQVGLLPANNAGILIPQSTLSPNHNENLEGNQSNASLEQLGCGWDWITNSCKDLFNINWCGKCHDFGNIFLHDCKCVAPLIPLPTTIRPTPPPPPPPPQRQPLLFWLI